MSGEAAQPTLAEALDGVRWDHDPVRGRVSPLLPAALYFQDFPWDGRSEPPPAPPDQLPRNSPTGASDSL